VSVPDLTRVNLTKAVVLVVETTTHAADVLAQILKGFGVAETHRCTSVKEAEKVLSTRSVDLIIVDPDVKDGDGYEFLRKLRASHQEPNCYAPIILISGHARISNVKRARDTGANFFIGKPIAPNTLLERILWIGRDKRPFVEAGVYIGPDRRFKFEGPPPNSEGRRASDLTQPLGDADEPNMSQNEIDNLLKPQRVLV